MKRKLTNLNKVLGVILSILVIVAGVMVYTKHAKKIELDKASNSLKAAVEKAETEAPVEEAPAADAE